MKDINNVPDRIRAISFPPKRHILFDVGEAEEIIRRFNEILEREHWEFSKGIWMAVSEYVERHGPGNPAQQLTRFIEGKGMYHAPKGYCHMRGCPGLAIGIAIHGKSRAKRQFCGNHMREALKAGWVKDE